jgi:hypothetical protein
MSWLGCPVLGLRQTSIADMRLVNCYSRSVLGPSSLPSQFTELFGMGVKEAHAVLYGRCSATDSAFVSGEHRAWVRRFIGLESLRVMRVPSLVSNRMWLARSFPRITGSRLDIVWLANYKAYKEGLEDMPHRCLTPVRSRM